jgi:hypothetical protein
MFLFYILKGRNFWSPGTEFWEKIQDPNPGYFRIRNTGSKRKDYTGSQIQYKINIDSQARTGTGTIF